MKVAIIGTAGRNEDAAKLSEKLFQKMIEKAKDVIENTFKLDKSKITLVSGASSYTDDIVPILHDTGKFAGMELYLPSRWDDKKKCFNGSSHPDGYSLNNYHEVYSKVVYKDPNHSLHRLNRLKNSPNVVFHDEPIGFLSRNTLVARDCDYMIAFTFGKGNIPKIGGTSNTWKQSKKSCIKIHIPIDSL